MRRRSPRPPALAGLVLAAAALLQLRPAAPQFSGAQAQFDNKGGDGEGADTARMDIACAVNNEERVTVETGLHDHVEVVVTHMLGGAEPADAAKEEAWPACHRSGACKQLVLDLQFDEEVDGATLELPDGTLVRILRAEEVVVDMAAIQAQLELEAETMQTDFATMAFGNMLSILAFLVIMGVVGFIESQGHCLCGTAVHTLHMQQQEISNDVDLTMTFLKKVEKSKDNTEAFAAIIDKIEAVMTALGAREILEAQMAKGETMLAYGTVDAHRNKIAGAPTGAQLSSATFDSDSEELRRIENENENEG